jgi:hypothetical protein
MSKLRPSKDFFVAPLANFNIYHHVYEHNFARKLYFITVKFRALKVQKMVPIKIDIFSIIIGFIKSTY